MERHATATVLPDDDFAEPELKTFTLLSMLCDDGTYIPIEGEPLPDVPVRLLREWRFTYQSPSEMMMRLILQTVDERLSQWDR